MQNKPNLLDAQMNVSSVEIMNYEQITMNNANKKQTQSNLISPLTGFLIDPRSLSDKLQLQFFSSRMYA
jgi:hypothetical protein